jgi:hypothetical protein
MGHISYWSMLMIKIYWVIIQITVKKNTETLIDASKEAGVKVNAEKTKCMLLSHR